MRRRLAAGILGLALWAFGPADLRAGSAVVSAIFAGAHNGRLEVQIRASEPLNYLLVEGVEPFSVSLLFLNAVFAFPAEERELPGPGLTKVRTAVLERDGSRLGRLDLTFGERVSYRVLKEGTRVLVRVDAPPPARGLVLGGSQGETLPRAEPVPTPPQRPAVAVPLISRLTLEIRDEETSVIVEADGPLTYKSYTMDKPSRVVVDFERARLSRWEDTVEVGQGLLRRIRSSQFSRTTVRMVLDLSRPSPYWIEPQAQGVIIHLGTARRP